MFKSLGILGWVMFVLLNVDIIIGIFLYIQRKKLHTDLEDRVKKLEEHTEIWRKKIWENYKG